MKEEDFYGRPFISVLTSSTGMDTRTDTTGSYKDSNPKDAVGIAKVPMSTVPSQVLMEVGLAMFEGARKYGRHNYRAVGVRTSVYYDALQRHILAFWEGQDNDPDSGLSHITKAIATLVVLRDAYITGNVVDDRPPVTQNTKWIEELNAKAKALIAKYPDAKDAYTEKGMPKDASLQLEPYRPSNQPHPVQWAVQRDFKAEGNGAGVQRVLPLGISTSDKCSS